MTELGRLRWPEISARRSATLVVPVGSTEQHGPHLPLDTDTRIAVALAERACADTPPEVDTVIAPPLAYGSSGEHQDFAGTLSLGTEVLTSVLVELCRSARTSFARIVLVNGHGGNCVAVVAAVELLRSEGQDVRAWSPSFRGGDAHAGATETSMLLHLCPEVVDMERAEAGVLRPIEELLTDLQRDGVSAHAPNGVLGDPTGATAAAGEALFDAAAASLGRLLRAD